MSCVTQIVRITLVNLILTQQICVPAQRLLTFSVIGINVKTLAHMHLSESASEAVARTSVLSSLCPVAVMRGLAVGRARDKH